MNNEQLSVPLSDPARNTVGKHHWLPRVTEVRAALSVRPKSGTQRMRVLNAVWTNERGFGGGLTDPEIVEATGLLLQSVCARRNELMQGGWVTDSGRRRETGNGGKAIVWQLTEPAKQQIKEGL